MATASDLPQELLDHILDLLQTDFRALKTCTVLGRRWLPRAQKYLFRTLSLPCRRDTPGYIIASESGDVSPDDAEARISEIICFLRDRPSLSSLVKSFTLDAQSSDTLVRASCRMFSELPFRELTSFGIVMFPLDELKQPDYRHIEQFLILNRDSLCSLAFESTGNAHPVQMLLSHCCPSLYQLRHLYLNDLGIYYPSHQADWVQSDISVVSEMRQLETLRIGGWHYASHFLPDLFLNIHASLGISSRLHTLHLSTNWSLDPYGHIFSLCGESLKHLKLCIALTELTENHRTSFGYLQKLETLDVTFTKRYSPNHLSLLLDIFSSRPELKQMELACSNSVTMYMNSIQTLLTTEVDGALATFIRRSPRLGNIILFLPENLYEEAIAKRSLVERLIPRAMQAGKLQIRCNSLSF